jgi:hypothetical protein
MKTQIKATFTSISIILLASMQLFAEEKIESQYKDSVDKIPLEIVYISEADLAKDKKEAKLRENTLYWASEEKTEDNSPTITNEEDRKFLRLKSEQPATKILRAFNVPKGATRATVTIIGVAKFPEGSAPEKGLIGVASQIKSGKEEQTDVTIPNPKDPDWKKCKSYVYLEPEVQQLVVSVERNGESGIDVEMIRVSFDWHFFMSPVEVAPKEKFVPPVNSPKPISKNFFKIEIEEKARRI